MFHVFLVPDATLCQRLTALFCFHTFFKSLDASYFNRFSDIELKSLAFASEKRRIIIALPQEVAFWEKVAFEQMTDAVVFLLMTT